MGGLPDERRRSSSPARSRGGYLAVRDVRIDCPFPHAQVRHLGIVDLPGLGEFAARADQHHVGGLQNEVDVVLLVKRPVEGMAYWGDADARALDLIDSARGFVDRRDFVFLVLNTGDTAEALVTALRDHIRGQVNSGVPDQFFQVLECDAADTGDVFARVLSAGAGPPRGPDAGDGRRRGRRHPGRAARRRAADRDAHRRRGAGAGVGRAVVGQRGRRPRPAVAAAAPGPVRGAGRAGRRAARAGPGGRGGPGLHRRRRARLRHHARVDHGRARGRRAGVARRGAARHDGRPQQQPLRRRRAQPGPGGDQQLLRGDRRLLRRAGAGAVGAGRADHRASTPGALLDGRTRRRATTPCAGSSRCSPRPPSPARGCGGPSSSCSPCGWTTAPSCTPGCAPSWTG